MKISLKVLGSSLFLIALLGFQPTANAAPGDLDLTFSMDGKMFDFIRMGREDYIYDTALQPDGKIVATGEFNFGAIDSCAVARYNADGGLDPSFGEGGIVRVPTAEQFTCEGIAVQADGKIVVAGRKGDFAVMRFNSDGSFDQTFGNGGLTTTSVGTNSSGAWDVAIQPDGKIVTVGMGTGNVVVIRYMPNGTLDNSFDTDGKAYSLTSGLATSVEILPDGKILTAGRVGTFSQFGFVRFNSNGSRDNSFGGNGTVEAGDLATGEANDVAVQPDGKIVAVGSITVITGTGNPPPQNIEFIVTRRNSDGSPDLSFDGDGKTILHVSDFDDFAYSVALQNDGKIVIGGSAKNGAGPTHNMALVRLNTDGSPDGTFNGTGILTSPQSTSNDVLNNVLIQPDGKIVAGGYADFASGFRIDDFALARFNTDGSTDNSFNSGFGVLTNIGIFKTSARAVAMMPDGRYVVAVTQGSMADDDIAVIRYNADGTPDSSFGVAGKVWSHFTDNDELVYSVAVQPDGKVVIVGKLGLGSIVVRYTADGSVDNTFDGDGMKVFQNALFHDLLGVAVQTDGKIVLTGAEQQSGGDPQFVLTRLNSDGSPDSTFDGDGTAYVTGLVSGTGRVVTIQSDGKIVAGGRKYAIGNDDFAVVRYNTNGTPDNSFDGDGVATTPVLSFHDRATSLAIQRDGKIVLAGTAMIQTGFNDEVAVVRFNANGTLDSSFDFDGKMTTSFLGGTDKANAVQIQANGKILVAGSAAESTNLSAFDDVAMLRLKHDGSIDPAFSGDGKQLIDFWGGSNDIAYGMALDSRGRAIVVGEASGNIAIARVISDFVPAGRAPFDFDGDGKTDIGIYRPSVGEWWYQRSSDGQVPAYGFGSSTDVIVPADFTGDGKTDVAFFRPATGQWFVLRSEDNSYFAFPFGQDGDIPVPADFDGDGKADPAVFRPSDGWWHIAKSTGGTTSVQFGTNGDQPVAADYDGDSMTDIAIYRPSVGEWWLLRSTAGVIAYAFGNANDRTVPADYTGDGKADVAFWRPATGEWFVIRSEDTSYYSGPFGASTDIVAPGDYDGDGKADLTVFRPSNGTWYSQRSSAGTLAVQFGAGGDRPIPNAFVR